jgi:two-component system CheB/CheR fusion protein
MIDQSDSSLAANNFSDMSMESEQNPHDRFKVVAIGASAGGLEVFTQILSDLPIDTGMGFVLIQHLAPHYDSQLSEILQKTTQMTVREAQEDMSIEPNSVYVIPPNTLMTLEHGILKLESRQLVKGKYMAIDGFFNSLANDSGDQAIAVILSGNNEDGTKGLEAIKTLGGITIAQDLASAQFPTMPMIAIASGYVDFVLSPMKIAAELVNISHDSGESVDSKMNTAITVYEPNDQTASIFAESPENQEALKIVLRLLHNAMGVDFSYYKQGTLRRRIARRMNLLTFQQLDLYAEYLQSHPIEVEKLYHDILINVTSFFRDPESFRALRQQVFPAICEHKSQELPIRIWVAGCATGEEVYSIAISLLEFFDTYAVKHAIQIFATDISEIAIETARSGIYAENLLIDISPEQLRRFFKPVEGGYQIGKLVRELCVFARQNLTSDPPFSRMDLISCRNMLIYLEPVLQKKVMPIFHYALNSNGFLMLGSSEGIGNAGDLFNIVDKKSRIYKSKPIQSRMAFNFDSQRHQYVDHSSTLAIRHKTPMEEINLEQLADQVVLSRYAPVGVVINADLEILQFRGQTSAYLEPSPGKASLNLLSMVRSELRLDLRTAIYSAKERNTPISKDGIEMSQGVLVKLDVIPLVANSEQYFLVLFENHPSQILLAPASIDSSINSSVNSSTNPSTNSLAKYRKDGATRENMEIVRLTHELEKTKEYLRSIIEKQEANNQDLKVAGEEILSSNEELQSANEELETAKEEIQATNEELTTINDELRSRNNQLSQVNNDMQNLLSSVNIPILMLSGDLLIRRFTPMAEQAFNLMPSDVGRPFSHIRNNLDLPNIEALITSVIDSLIPYEQDVQDQQGHWYSLRIRPYRTTDNHIDGVVIGLIDINLIKQNAIALEFSRNYANAIIETLRQPLIVLNDEMQVVTANLCFYKLFKMSPDQTEQQSIFALSTGAWDTPKLRSLLDEILLRDISVHDYEVTQDFAKLGTRTMLLNASQIDRPNIGTMILIVIEDITERNLQKQQLIIKNQALSEAMISLEAANIAKSKFLGNMSHELRTPLTAIIGFTQLLQTNQTKEAEAQQFLDMIYQSGEHLLSLIQDLLDISKIESEKMEIEPNILSLGNFLQMTAEMLQIKAGQKNLTFTKQFAADLPEVIYADEKRLRQVLLNLLSNAIKFTSTGEITFAVSRHPSTDQAGDLNEFIRFAITDTGTGISANDLEKIFLPFEQVGTEDTKPQGTGLGLAISQNLVNKMGGSIKVISEIGVGSTFSFDLNLIEPQLSLPILPEAISEKLPEATPEILPEATSEILPEATSEILPEATSEILPEATSEILPEATPEKLPEKLLAIASSAPPQIDNILDPATSEQISLDQAAIVNKVKLAATLPLNILVADDVQYNQILLQKFLQRLGYEPDIVNNGKEVLAQMRQNHYDAILMDIQMNDIDGIETMRQILAEWDQKNRPFIIAVTANASQEDRDKYLAAGMDEYMSKPIDFALLEKILLQVCSRIK